MSVASKVKCRGCGSEWDQEVINQYLQPIKISSPGKIGVDDARVFICREDGHPLVLVWNRFAYSLVLEHGTSDGKF